MGKKITLASGAELDITMSDFEEGDALLQAVVSELEGISITSNDDQVSIFKNIFARAILSPKIKAALKPCLLKTTYNNIKLINNDVFQDEKNRADYLIVLKEVLEYNLTPFFVNLISMLKDIEAKIKIAQMSK